MRRQTRRLNHLCGMLKAAGGMWGPAIPQLSATWSRHLGSELQNVQKRAQTAGEVLRGRQRIQSPIVKSSIDGEYAASPQEAAGAINEEVTRMGAILATAAAEARRTRLKRTRRRLNGPDALTNAFLRTRDLTAQPIRAIRASDGRYTADPVEVDAHACQQWGNLRRHRPRPQHRSRRLCST